MIYLLSTVFFFFFLEKDTRYFSRGDQKLGLSLSAPFTNLDDF